MAHRLARTGVSRSAYAHIARSVWFVAINRRRGICAPSGRCVSSSVSAARRARRRRQERVARGLCPSRQECLAWLMAEAQGCGGAAQTSEQDWEAAGRRTS